MASLQDSINSGEAALQALYKLQTKAMQDGDLVTQKALEDDIDDLTYKLTQLNSAKIAGDDTQINALGTQLDKVTAVAKQALESVSSISDVLSAVVTAAKLLDGILSLAIKI